MDKDRQNRPDPDPRGSSTNRMERNSSAPNDLPDKPEDLEKLQPEETLIDLPDVKDIPGQEFVNAPPLGSLGDTTIASDDEEGTAIFDRDDSRDLRRGNESDVDRNERKALEDTEYMPTKDEDNLYRASMDHTDFQGEELNERSFGDERSGSDLDTEES
jgi:hypothetical protein